MTFDFTDPQIDLIVRSLQTHSTNQYDRGEDTAIHAFHEEAMHEDESRTAVKLANEIALDFFFEDLKRGDLIVEGGESDE